MPHHEYPKWIYHKSEKPKLVHSKEQHDEHGPEWKSSPADHVKSEAKYDESPEQKHEEPKSKKGKR